MKLTSHINPTQAYIHEEVTLDNGMIVQRYSICMTDMISYQVWEPSKMRGGHSTITSIDGKWYGSLTTRPLPAEIEALPTYKPGYWPQARIAAVQAFHAELQQQAETIIRATFPQDFA